MGKGDGGCDSGTTARRNVEQELSDLQEEVAVLRDVVNRTSGAGRDGLQEEVANRVAQLESELGEAQEQIADLEEKTEPKGLAKLWKKALKDKGLYFGGATVALGVMTANPLLMAVGGAAMGLNKLRHMREDEDRLKEYIALRGGDLETTVGELDRFKNLSREEQEEIIENKRRERQENGGNPVVSFIDEAPAPAATEPPPTERQDYQEDSGPESDPVSQEQAEPEFNPDQEAFGQALDMSDQAADRIGEDIRDWLYSEQKEAGEDYGEEISDRAILARELLLAANAEHLPAEDAEAIRAAVALVEGENLYSKKEMAAEKKRLESEDNALKRETGKVAEQYDKKIAKLGEKRAQILQQVQEMEAAGEMNEQVAASAEAALGQIAQEGQQILAEKAQAMQPYAARAKDLDNKIKAYNDKVAVKHSPQLGNIPSLVNLVLDRDGQAACRKCGRVPRTVRRSCSGCGSPFVLSEDTMPLVGRGDEGLQEMGQLGLVEEYEGDAERRREKLGLWREGKGTVSQEEVKRRQKRTGQKKEAASGGTSSSKKEKAEKKKEGAAPSSSGPREVSTDQSEEDYIKERNAAREEWERNDPRYKKAKKAAEQKAKKEGREVARLTSSIAVTGKEQFPAKVRKQAKKETGKEIHQVDAVLDGVFPADFNVYPGETNLRRARAGDRVILRNNDNSKALGHAVIDKVINVDLAPDDHKDDAKLAEKLEPMWDEVKDRMPAWYKKDDFMAYMTGQIKSNPKRTNASMVVYGKTYRFPEPMKANGQGGFATLQGSAAAQQDLIDAVYRNEYREAKGSKKAGGSKEKPKKTTGKKASSAKTTGKKESKKADVARASKCEATTADGKPCKKLKSPKSKYCVIHKKKRSKTTA